MRNVVLCGHAIDKLKEIPEETVQTCITSVPYWGLRDYKIPAQIWPDSLPLCDEHDWVEHSEPPRGGKNAADNPPNVRANIAMDQTDVSGKCTITNFCQRCGAWRGDLGLEPTPELYVKHIVEVFREVRRVLRPDGVLWINLGDSYSGGGKGGQSEEKRSENWQPEYGNKGNIPIGLKPKDLCGIPWRVAFALQADDWWLRSDNIWYKRNPMPQSVNGWRWEQHRIKVKKGRVSRHGTAGVDEGGVGERRDGAKWIDCPGCPKCLPNDGLILIKGSWRTTTAHEYIFMLAKSDEYYCDREAVSEELAYPDETRRPMGSKGAWEMDGRKQRENGGGSSYDGYPSSRNLRSVWDITTKPFSGAHFAVFPEDIPITCIKASTSEKGQCSKCGSPIVRVVRPSKRYADVLGYGYHDHTEDLTQGMKSVSGTNLQNKMRDAGVNAPELETIAWRPSCNCNAEVVPQIVLDPFGGSGTTADVAKRLGRAYIIIDLSEKYVKNLIELRLNNIDPLFQKSTP